jgi:methylphosphotriester-DNA--protein-cysteine methyltransferase/mannose-6-phosphate isomerase-like protein (cupin superfamily)
VGHELPPCLVERFEVIAEQQRELSVGRGSCRAGARRTRRCPHATGTGGSIGRFGRITAREKNQGGRRQQRVNPGNHAGKLPRACTRSFSLFALWKGTCGLVEYIPAVVRGALFQPFPMRPGHRAQVWRHQPSYRRPRHFHGEPEINLVVSGRARIGVGADVMTLEAGEFVLLAPGVDHVLFEASDDLDLLVTALRPELAARAVKLSLASLNGTRRFEAAELRDVADELGALSDISDPLTHEHRLCALFRRATAATPNVHVISRRALASVLADPAVSGSGLAHRIRATPSALSRNFRSDFGVTFVEFRARVRLMRFIELVDGGQRFVSAALDADFGSYAQCHRVFRRALGCSPQQYFAGTRESIAHAIAGELSAAR